MNSKQTALQLFVDKITNNHDKHFRDFYKAEIEEALQMEREQMIDAHVHGHNAPSSTIKQYDAQQYVNETYGGKNEK
jgi:hypothetical protein